MDKNDTMNLSAHAGIRPVRRMIGGMTWQSQNRR
jgi:hypothetical protein